MNVNEQQFFDDLETFKTKNSLTKQFHELWYLFEQLRLKMDEVNNLSDIAWRCWNTHIFPDHLFDR